MNDIRERITSKIMQEGGVHDWWINDEGEWEFWACAESIKNITDAAEKVGLQVELKQELVNARFLVLNSNISAKE